MTQTPDTILMQVQNDLTRPRYHFGAPVGWMNDPNGTIFYNGYYHLFYQWNPESDQWGNIHWGHARSRDLINWEHLPIALKPDPTLGEEHCFSGCLTLRENESPLILYTAIGPQMDVRNSPQQWAAVGDDQLLTWQKHPRNPILTLQIHDGMEVFDWRDPFVFSDNGRIFLLLGGKLSETDGGAAVVLLYEAENPTLEQWSYRGILFRHPDLSRVSVECANLFKSGNQWVLLLSTHKLVECHIGDFDADAGVFTAQSSDLLDGSDQFYATNILLDDKQRQICFGWIRGFAPNQGWSGCMSLPRVLSVDENGEFHQFPAPEVDMLHAEGFHASAIPLGTYPLEDFQSASMDVHAVITSTLNTKIGLRLIPINEQAETITLTCAEKKIYLNDKSISYQRHELVDIRLFLDRSVVEVFVDSHVALTLVLPPVASSYRVEVFSESDDATLSRLDVWHMQVPQ